MITTPKDVEIFCDLMRQRLMAEIGRGNKAAWSLYQGDRLVDAPADSDRHYTMDHRRDAVLTITVHMGRHVAESREGQAR